MPPREDTSQPLPDGYFPSDSGNARRFVDLAAGRARYVPAWGKWLVYSDGRWHIDLSTAYATELGRQVALELRRLAADTPDSREARKVFDWALASERAAGIAAMLNLARGAPGILTDHDELDQHPWLLNCRNGEVDTRTGELLPHDPAHLFTMQAPTDYLEDAHSDLWERCVETWLPDAELREFVQRIAGTAMTGHPLERLILNYGTGGNGKSKFYGALTAALGSYAVEGHKSLFLLERHEQHDTVRSSLFRARMVTAPETKQGDRLAEEQIKALTGGDRITARRMREDEWHFWPTHTIIMHTNHPPRVQGTDEGIWRRVLLIPWTVTIPEGERDDDLKAKLEEDRSAVLRWAVLGAMAWHADGRRLYPPCAVVDATKDYRREEDEVGRFIADWCVVGPHLKVDTRKLRSAYEEWCEIEGARALGATAFARDLTSRGYAQEPSGGGRRSRLGLTLSESAHAYGEIPI